MFRPTARFFVLVVLTGYVIVAASGLVVPLSEVTTSATRQNLVSPRSKRNVNLHVSSSSSSSIPEKGEVAASNDERKLPNLRVLGKLSLSGLLAYGYLRYFAWTVAASLAYAVYQKTVRQRGGNRGTWLGMGLIFLVLAALPKILVPIKFALQVVVTFFFSTLFVMLAHAESAETSSSID